MTGYRIVLAALAAVALVAVAPEANGKGGTPITACGQVVTTDAVLTQDLLTCTGDGLVVDADGIHRRSERAHPGGDHGVGDQGIIVFGFDKAKVENGVVRGFEIGVRAVLAERLSIVDVVASDNQTGFDLSGDSVSISSSTASSNSGRGIQVTGDKASVKSATATGTETGIGVSSDAGKITGCRVGTHSRRHIRVSEVVEPVRQRVQRHRDLWKSGTRQRQPGRRKRLRRLHGPVSDPR